MPRDRAAQSGVARGGSAFLRTHELCGGGHRARVCAPTLAPEQITHHAATPAPYCTTPRPYVVMCTPERWAYSGFPLSGSCATGCRARSPHGWGHGVPERGQPETTQRSGARAAAQLRAANLARAESAPPTAPASLRWPRSRDRCGRCARYRCAPARPGPPAPARPKRAGQ